MLFWCYIFSTHADMIYRRMWRSGAPWKEGLKMEDPNYLPIVPIFALVKPENYSDEIIADLLLLSKTPEFRPPVLIHDLNSQINVSQNLELLKKYCDQDISHACLILGRIYEFGSYNQTEDLDLAYKYYLKVRKLNDLSSLPMLSFLHRYYHMDLPASVIENDFSLTFSSVESILSSSLQYETGVLHPLSCPTSAYYISKLAKTAANMKYFPTHNVLNKTEIERISNSTHPEDLFKLAMHLLDVPYPSEREIKQAKKHLKLAYKKGLLKAGAMLAKLYVDRYPISEKLNVQVLLKYLGQGLRLGDPFSFILFSELFFTSRIDMQALKVFPITDLHALIEKATKSGYPPAIHQVALLTYYGLFGIPRSNSKGFQLFSQAAAKGYAPSQYSAAQQLVGGDGVVEDCQAAVQMFKRIIDLGPWADYLEKYVNRGSKHAFIKMLDMQLTPPIWLNITNSKEKGDEDPTNLLFKMVGTNFQFQNDESVDLRIKHLRKAREGDPASILWLSLKSPFSDSLVWINRMLLLPAPICYFAYFVKIYILSRAIKNYFYLGTMTESDGAILKQELFSYIPTLVIILISITLMILISVRVNIMFA